MKISVLQPEIERGNISRNTETLRQLINAAEGDFLVTAEYVLTGSLVLDENADVQTLTTESESAIQGLVIPEGKSLLINGPVKKNGSIYNACVLLPSRKIPQMKTNPDKTERNMGVSPCEAGVAPMRFGNKSVLILICSDIINISEISTDGVDLS